MSRVATALFSFLISLVALPHVCSALQTDVERAILGSNPEEVKRLIVSGADANERRSYSLGSYSVGWNGLMTALGSDDAMFVKVLLEGGATPTWQDLTGR